MGAPSAALVIDPTQALDLTALPSSLTRVVIVLRPKDMSASFVRRCVPHFDGIAAHCDHPVRFGVVESLNTTIKAVLRRARRMRDETMLIFRESELLRTGEGLPPPYYRQAI